MDVEVGLEEEDEGYEPEDIILYDNGSVIFDKYEFQEIFNCIAAQFYEGILYVLDRDTKKWRNVEDDKKAPSKLKTVQ